MIDELLEEAPYSAVRILEIITDQGFDGKIGIVKNYVRTKKKELNTKATVRFADSKLYLANRVKLIGLILEHSWMN